MGKIRKVKKIFTQGLVLLKFLYFKIYSCISKSVRDEFKDCWLISERGNDARDNGFFFFKYLKDKHPNINARFVITKDSPDFNKVNGICKCILFGSKDHYLAYINSKFIISTHLSGGSPDIGLFFRLQRYGIKKTKAKYVCLKHGITKDYLPFFNPKKNNLSLLITASKPEYNYFISKNGFSKDVVKLTGFARFDNLIKKESNQILFMPTHRKYMHYMKESEFIKSDYYLVINSLINNKNLFNLLDQNNLNFVFYIHPEFYKYVHLFYTSSSRIQIANPCDCEIQELLINSALLITDYSSVFFDFAYMQKPIIYYQFDYEMYRKNHYQEGYFDYQRDGFGDVCYQDEDVIKAITKSIRNKFKIAKKYQSKIDDFFTYKDKNNCDRIFNEIMKIVKNDGRYNDYAKESKENN